MGEEGPTTRGLRHDWAGRGLTKLRALVRDPESIERFLRHQDLWSPPQNLAPARAPPYWRRSGRSAVFQSRRPRSPRVVKAREIGHVDGSGTAFSEISSPRFSKILSREKDVGGARCCQRRPCRFPGSGSLGKRTANVRQCGHAGLFPFIVLSPIGRSHVSGAGGPVTGSPVRMCVVAWPTQKARAGGCGRASAVAFAAPPNRRSRRWRLKCRLQP
jgi:hypothetical protein